MTTISTLVSIAVIAAMVLLWSIKVYSDLVVLSNLKDEAWHGVDAQLRRRFDLVSSFVKTVADTRADDVDVRNVEEALSMIQRASTQAARIEAENSLSSSLRLLLESAKECSETTTDPNFGRILDKLSFQENELILARLFYDGMAQDFNDFVLSFPSSIISRKLGYRDVPYFEDLRAS
ncbi:MAG: LemA family protein [Synergistaceae bacterium]|nr:LemA family protein [Synergistaceae bacterium]